MRTTRVISAGVILTATLMGSLLLAAPANATDVVFADTALQACVNQSLGQADAAPVSTTQAASITQLNCYDRGITSIEGIQNLTSMWDLSFANNAVSDLSPVAGLTNLTQIGFAYNQVSDLGPLASLSKMVAIQAEGNSISDLASLSGLSKLNWLHVANNNISDLGPLSSLTQLAWLSMGTNQVADISPLVALTQLNTIYAINNHIADLSPLSGLIKIHSLDLGTNEITDLGPLATLVNLAGVGIQENHIADLTPLGGLPVLAQVYAQNQTLTLPDVLVGQSYPNPLREPHGATVTGVSGDANFVLAADGASWTYTALAANTLTWNFAYPGPVWPAWSFSGTFLQQSTVPVLRSTTLVDDSGTTPANQPITIDVLANDGLPTEPATVASSLALVDSSGNSTTQLVVAGGTFAVVNGRIEFTPATGFSGTVDTVKYRVANVDGLTGEAAVRITVTATVAPPRPPTPITTVTSGTSGASLAHTGSDLTGAGALALAALLLGAGALVASSRRRAMSTTRGCESRS